MNSLIACSTLPQHSAPTSSPISQVTANTPSRPPAFPLLDGQLAKHPQLTGYHLLATPSEALSARLALIDNAQQSIDMQYYIWHDDKIGNLFFYHLIQAGNRGVKIRLLIDDNNAKPIEGTLLALVQHPNIEIKLFNPYRFRKIRQFDWLFDVKRINRRMHNKTLIADQKLSIIGGRNIGNEYFNVSDEFQFADIDVLLAGQANDEIKHSFDEYWQDDYSFEVRDIVNAHRHTLRYPQLKQNLQHFYQAQKNTSEFQRIAQDNALFSNWLQHDLTLQWAKGQAFIDPVAKVRKQADKHDYVYPQLLKHIQMPSQHLDIISAYFVPRKDGTAQLAQMEQNGVNVRILTNSFASNDVEMVHAFYSPYRKPLLESGVELYEFLPITMIDQFMQSDDDITQSPHKKEKNSAKSVPKSNVTQGGSSHASLHAKTYIIDNQQVFIGSMNLDPRSIIYNTELGVLLDSPPLAQHLHDDMNHQISHYAWQLQLNPQGKILWTLPAQDGQAPIILEKEPEISWWQKASLMAFSWLPIENLF